MCVCVCVCMCVCVCVCVFFIVNETPELKELRGLIVPNYAVSWNEIGIGLGLAYEALQIIETDCARITQRCTDMLAKWLQKDVNATWQKLLQVIDSLPVANSVSPTLQSSHDESKHINCMLSFHVLVSYPHMCVHTCTVCLCLKIRFCSIHILVYMHLTLITGCC